MRVTARRRLRRAWLAIRAVVHKGVQVAARVVIGANGRRKAAATRRGGGGERPSEKALKYYRTYRPAFSCTQRVVFPVVFFDIFFLTRVLHVAARTRRGAARAPDLQSQHASRLATAPRDG